MSIWCKCEPDHEYLVISYCNLLTGQQPRAALFTDSCQSHSPNPGWELILYSCWPSASSQKALEQPRTQRPYKTIRPNLSTPHLSEYSQTLPTHPFSSTQSISKDFVTILHWYESLLPAYGLVWCQSDVNVNQIMNISWSHTVISSLVNSLEQPSLPTLVRVIHLILVENLFCTLVGPRQAARKH